MSQVIRITKSQLTQLFLDVESATMISLSTETIPDMRVKGNPFRDDVIKCTEINGVYMWDYETAVNRRLMKEGGKPTFKVQARAWGKLVDGTGMVHHIDKKNAEHWYVQLKAQHCMDVMYIHRDRNPFTQEEVEILKTFIPEREEGVNQGLDVPVVIRDYAIDSIREARMFGNVYIVED